MRTERLIKALWYEDATPGDWADELGITPEALFQKVFGLWGMEFDAWVSKRSSGTRTSRRRRSAGFLRGSIWTRRRKTVFFTHKVS